MGRGVVAAGHPATADAAAEVLRDGGNAVDAALAGALAACVAEPIFASLGGGGFLMVHMAEGHHAGRSIAYDFFVQTPKRKMPATQTDLQEIAADFGAAQQMFAVGMGSIATPGMVRGLFTAHGDLGRVPLRRIVEPTCLLAKQGAVVTALQSTVFRVVGAILARGEETQRLFGRASEPGTWLREGDVVRLPEMADVLETLACEGDDLFYRGELCQALVQACASGGGHLQRADLEDYRCERRRPLALDAFRCRIQMNPPPAAGGMLVALGLALWQVATAEWGAEDTPGERLRRRLRCLGVLTKARPVFGAELPEDPSADLQQLIARYRQDVLPAPPSARGTTHISVVDQHGNAAAISLSNGEGSGYVLPGTNIQLNNMLGEEDLLPGELASWATDTRMSSMMAPSLVQTADGGIAALGSGGSQRIRSALTQVLLHLLCEGRSLEEAVAAPRMHVDAGVLSCEPGFSEADYAAIADLAVRSGEPSETPVPTDDVPDAPLRCHIWPEKSLFFGGVHAVYRDGRGGVEGAGDERRCGTVRFA